MRAWRLCRERFADLSGDGARRYGGRWSSPGRPVVYAAETAALAVLEVRVHLDLPWDLLPTDYALVEIDLDEGQVEDVPDLPTDTAAFGDEWLRARRTPFLKVPSVIVPESRNVLLNPLHPDAAEARITGVRPFGFDPRLWTSTSR